MMMKLFKTSAAAAALAVALMLGAGPAMAEVGKPPARDWSFDGMFGTFDRGAAQRGFQVYQEVCAACHSLKLVAYRNLSGIGLSEDQIKAIAAEVEVTDGPNDEGEMFQRPARPSDRFVKPFANDNAARAANNGALPPDLSLMVKARKGGADYLHALLTGYKEEPPAGIKLSEGMNYNLYFPGNQIAMAPPVADDAVEYADGTKATADQIATDVATFLAWAAEPELRSEEHTSELQSRRKLVCRLLLGKKKYPS